MTTGPGRTELDSALRNRALDVADEGITIADLRLADAPLIFVNQGFERLTGYAAEDVLGKNCRFLQGPGTDSSAADEIRQAIARRRSCVVEILNYRKDGTPFWNRLSITPVRDAAGEVSHYIGVQSDVSDRRAAEDALRAANAALETAGRRTRRSLDAAARIQRSLLPSAFPEIAGVSFAFGFKPCDELAGDALNVVRLDENRVGLYVLDVSGHGVPAALMSVTLTRVLSPSFDGTCLLSPAEGESAAPSITPPARVADLLNQQFPMDLETAQYFTMLYGVLDVRRQISASWRLATRRRRWCAGARPRAWSGSGGVPVGLVEVPGYTETRLPLESGDRVFFYSDGVTDAYEVADHEEQTGRFSRPSRQPAGSRSSTRSKPSSRPSSDGRADPGSETTSRSWPSRSPEPPRPPGEANRVMVVPLRRSQCPTHREKPDVALEEDPLPE